MTPTKAVPDEAIIEAIQDAIQDGETLPAGGVPTTEIAARVDMSASGVWKRCQSLTEGGTLERDWGIDANQTARLGYRPRNQDED